MNNEFEIAGLQCFCAAPKHGSRQLVYLLYPADGLAKWAAEAAERYGVNIVVITGMDWDNDLTPWPAKGVPKGSPDFKGLASEFLSRLREEVIPAAEKRLNLHCTAAERTLIGVSLSGLFTLWQWVGCDLFGSIGSLSGSFWYDGFVDWFCRQTLVSHGEGARAFFLLGEAEPKSRVKAFQSVGVDTQRVVQHVQSLGIATEFQWVPGDHFTDPLGRLEIAMSWLVGDGVKA